MLIRGRVRYGGAAVKALTARTGTLKKRRFLPNGGLGDSW